MRTFRSLPVFCVAVLVLSLLSCGKKTETQVSNFAETKMLTVSNETNSPNRKILWKDIEVGMSLDDVQKLYPTAEYSEFEDETTQGETLEFDGVDIQRNRFIVNFFFKERKLDAVGLMPKETTKSGESKQLYYGVRQELVEKYGPPVEDISGRINLLYSYEQCQWNPEGIIIELYHKYSITGIEDSTLYIFYTTGTIEKEDNL